MKRVASVGILFCGIAAIAWVTLLWVEYFGDKPQQGGVSNSVTMSRSDALGDKVLVCCQGPSGDGLNMLLRPLESKGDQLVVSIQVSGDWGTLTRKIPMDVPIARFTYKLLDQV